MRLPKVFYFTGDYASKSSLLFILIGIIGAIINVYGLINHSVQIYYVAGSALMALSAFYFRLYYFVALEIILTSGHIASILGLGLISKIILPIFLTIQLVVYYFFKDGFFRDPWRIVGIAGIIILSLGFVYYDEWLYFAGSIAVAIYAIHKACEGVYVAMIWVIVNLIFAIIALGIIIFSNPNLWDYPAL